MEAEVTDCGDLVTSGISINGASLRTCTNRVQCVTQETRLYTLYKLGIFIIVIKGKEKKMEETYVEKFET